MGNANLVFEWEGDATQALGSLTYKGRKELFAKRLRFSVARILFERGDLEDHWDLVEARNDIITRNLAKIAEGSIDGAGGRVGGGFWFAEVPIVGTMLETVPDLPVYAGDLTLSFKTYLAGTLVSTKTIYSDKPFRIGVSQRGTAWEFEVIGNVDRISQIDVATSVREIMEEQVQEG